MLNPFGLLKFRNIKKWKQFYSSSFFQFKLNGMIINFLVTDVFIPGEIVGIVLGRNIKLNFDKSVGGCVDILYFDNLIDSKIIFIFDAQNVKLVLIH